MLAAALILTCTALVAVFAVSPNRPVSPVETQWRRLEKDAFLDELVSQMSIPELGKFINLRTANMRES